MASVQISPSNIGDDVVQTVNARELHLFLESGQEFRHWIKARIEQYGFVEGQDFVTSENIIRGGKATEYHISIDMAKELSMVERTYKGKMARLYFLECEKKAHAVPVVALDDPRQLRTLLLGYTEKVIQLEQKIEEDKPKVESSMDLRKDRTLSAFPRIRKPRLRVAKGTQYVLLIITERCNP